MRGGTDGGGCFPSGKHYPGIAHLLRVEARGLAEGFSPTDAIAALPLVSIDTETTGKDPELDRIVEVACVFWRDGAVVERRTWLLNPGRSIPADVVAVHGITDEQVRDQPTFAGVKDELLAALTGCVPVAYNAEFDRRFLQAEFDRTRPHRLEPPSLRREVEWIDPLIWARKLQEQERSRSLAEVCDRLGVRLARAHRAADDAEAALLVLIEFCKDTRVPRTYAAFMQEQRRLAREFEAKARRWRAAAQSPEPARASGTTGRPARSSGSAPPPALSTPEDL